MSKPLQREDIKGLESFEALAESSERLLINERAGCEIRVKLNQSRVSDEFRISTDGL